MTRDVVKTLLASCLCLSLVACGDDDGGGGGTPDAAVNPNTGDFYEYVLTELTLPTSGTANALGFDLDGISDTSDNKLGSILSIVPADLQGSVDGSVQSGSLVLLSAIRADSLTDDDAALLQVWVGDAATAAPTPGASYTIASMSPMNATVTGSISGGVFEGRNGTVPLTVPLLEGVPPLNITLYGAAVRVAVTADAFDDISSSDPGRLGGAIKEEDVETQVLPAVAAFAQEVINGDSDDAAGSDNPDGTPDCTCSGPGTRSCQNSQSNAAQVASLFDTNEDCNVTAEELMNNGTVQAVLNPDVDLFDASGNYNPGSEGEEGFDALSLGVGINGINAMFARPGE